MTTEMHVPRMTKVQSRVHLTTLALTEPGDVFYLVSDPATVVTREAGWFQYLGDEVWRELEHVGTGEPAQRVVVIHNTQKYCAGPAEEC